MSDLRQHLLENGEQGGSDEQGGNPSEDSTNYFDGIKGISSFTPPKPKLVYQRRFLLFIALGVPTVKFLFACTLIVRLIDDDTVGKELKHPAKDGSIGHGELVLIQALFCVPLAILAFTLGYITFSKYPKIHPSGLNEYFTFYALIFLLQLLSLSVTLGKVPFTIWENTSVFVMTATEAYTIYMIRWCVQQKFKSQIISQAVELQSINALQLQESMNDTNDLAV